MAHGALIYIAAYPPLGLPDLAWSGTQGLVAFEVNPPGRLLSV